MKQHFSTSIVYVMPIIIGFLIVLGVLLTYNQFSAYQDNLVQTNKVHQIQTIDNMIERRQARIQTIAASIIAFYEGSQNVEEHEFQIFSKRILESNPEILNIFVLENNDIIQSYPNRDILSQNFDSLFPSFPIIVNEQEQLSATFSISNELSVIILFPTNYFLSEDDLFFDNYKVILSSQIEGIKLYEVAKIQGIKSFDNIEFSTQELKDSLTISKTTDLRGKKLGENYIFKYTIWDDTFSSATDFTEIFIIVIGIILSIIIPLLLYNSKKLSISLKIQSIDLKIAYDKLKQAERQKDEFTTMVTHELKTPLVPITGYSELLLDGTLGDLSEKQRTKIEIIKANGEKLNRLISDILDAHKLELGQFKINPAAVSINKIISESLTTFVLQAQNNNIKLEFLPQDDFTIRCDSDRIAQVINNLVSNSMKFVPKNTGLIQVATKSDDNMCIVSVSDNGLGIPKSSQYDIFKKFYQIDTSLTRKPGGTGLGLAISKGIVTAHNGQIWFESNENKGSTFYFSLPIDHQK